MPLLYNIAVSLYGAGLRAASLWHPKARQWVTGRKNLFAELEAALSPSDKIIWLHCSSAGEFEQGKPVAEALKQRYPSYKLLISFFSPSGFSVARGYPSADCICYLPLDTEAQARRFVRMVNPVLVVFVKYEFWYNILSALAFRHIPVLLVSASFRPGQVFFRKGGSFFRQMLFLFRHLFVQDEASRELLLANGITHCSVSGDTRFDRVAQIARSRPSLPIIEIFLQGRPCILAGSTWPDDEALLHTLTTLGGGLACKLIVAPHEITPAHLTELASRFPQAVLYSSLSNGGGTDAPVLIVDNVGMLSRLYAYASIAYIGGGFTKDGIHNLLEAAVWGVPVVFGPNHAKYREAGELIAAGGAFSIETADELNEAVSHLLANDEHRRQAGENAKGYVKRNEGATERILAYIQENRLLTN